MYANQPISQPISQPTVAVITLVRGCLGIELERAIQSVRNQTHPCSHYILVRREVFYKKTSEIVQKFSNLVVVFLPENTASIDNLVSKLVKEEIIIYLNDNEWLAMDYVENYLKIKSNHQ